MVGFSVTGVSGAGRPVRVVPPANAVGAVALVLRPVRALRVGLRDAPCTGAFDAAFDAADLEEVGFDGVDFDAADLEVTDFDAADFEVVDFDFDFDFEARAVVDFAVDFEVDRPVLALLLFLATTPPSRFQNDQPIRNNRNDGTLPSGAPQPPESAEKVQSVRASSTAAGHRSASASAATRPTTGMTARTAA